MYFEQTKLAVVDGLARYLDNAALSDSTITCDGRQWKVHRLVLSLHSSVLAKACDGHFAEAKDMKYDLSAHDKDDVEALIKYLYTFDYDAEEGEVGEQLSLHTSLYCMSDKYDIAGLRKLAVAKTKETIRSVTTSTDIANACGVAYDHHGATAEIRECLVNFIVEHATFLQDLPENKHLQEVMRAHPDLPLEVARAATKKIGTSSRIVRYSAC